MNKLISPGGSGKQNIAVVTLIPKMVLTKGERRTSIHIWWQRIDSKENKEDSKNWIPSLAEAPAVFEKASLEDIILEQAELRIH